jgi:hypothetical protein
MIYIVGFLVLAIVIGALLGGKSFGSTVAIGVTALFVLVILLLIFGSNMNNDKVKENTVKIQSHRVSSEKDVLVIKMINFIKGNNKNPDCYTFMQVIGKDGYYPYFEAKTVLENSNLFPSKGKWDNGVSFIKYNPQNWELYNVGLKGPFYRMLVIYFDYDSKSQRLSNPKCFIEYQATRNGKTIKKRLGYNNPISNYWR